jgi:hypothetical protein
VRFAAWSDDHLPVYVRGVYAGIRVVADLLEDGTVRLSPRTRAIKPRSAMRADANHVLRIAQKFADELVTIWSPAGGTHDRFLAAVHTQ